MSDFEVRERRFEQDIEEYLVCGGGYIKGDSANFNKELALDVNTLLSFIKESQPKEWKKYLTVYGANSENKFIERFDHEVRTAGLLKVLREGFVDRGMRFRVVYWKPETSLNETIIKQYEDNTLTCTRQLHYSLQNNNSIDIVLFLNGIPVVSMELKCQFTGQDSTNAIKQYKFNRATKDKIFSFNERVLVHFAVDLDCVYMTTRLEGDNTYFLPFNQGSNGSGNVGGRGNPINSSGYATAYLWERVLCKDGLLEILQKFLHLQVIKSGKKNEVKSERMIFPRYHQLDVVNKLLLDVKKKGSGNNYLIQHSAGSGKSNSIAWLSYRLVGLHDDNNDKIFQSVIIVTDRRVLDSQLQNTVSQFDHVEGLIQMVDKNSQQLKEAIESGTGIIVTTLQKFPVIYKEVNSGNKRYAIIVDEAHSSQTGDAAKKLKRALADTEKSLEEYAEIEREFESQYKDEEDLLLDELAAHGKHENLSFFAFTATPKDKTLNMFGEKDHGGKYRPFHVYSMHQAIEEGFILDVLKNYMTYNTYYKIVKTIDDDPELESSAAIKAIKNYEKLHPHSIAQKTRIILEHFQAVTCKKINGKAKAMVVTSSRLHAVRYYQEFKKQIQDNKYKGLNILVAFSGEVLDHGEVFTEEKMNKNKAGSIIKEKALPEAFNSDEFGILIVAEKYQTGFDEPLLHTMFVDKKLSGVKAVQTLSRLNRTFPGKHDTFILDFVNTPEEIMGAFKPYYEVTTLESETDPNVIYDLKNTLDKYHIYRDKEITDFADIFFSNTNQEAGDLGKLQATVKLAINRYRVMEEQEQELFKTTLARFNRVYSFITQVCRLFDKDIHKFSVYGKFLYIMLPKGEKNDFEIDDKIMLEYYRLEKDFEGEISIESGESTLKTITGSAGRKEKKKEKFSELIDVINEKFGTNFTNMDKVMLQIIDDYKTEEKWQDYAINIDRETFMTLFKKEFSKKASDRYYENDAFFIKMFSSDWMLEEVSNKLGSQLYADLRTLVYPIHSEEGVRFVAEDSVNYDSEKKR